MNNVARNVPRYLKKSARDEQKKEKLKRIYPERSVLKRKKLLTRSRFVTRHRMVFSFHTLTPGVEQKG